MSPRATTALSLAVGALAWAVAVTVALRPSSAERAIAWVAAHAPPGEPLVVVDDALALALLDVVQRDRPTAGPVFLAWHDVVAMKTGDAPLPCAGPVVVVDRAGAAHPVPPWLEPIAPAAQVPVDDTGFTMTVYRRR